MGKLLFRLSFIPLIAFNCGSLVSSESASPDCQLHNVRPDHSCNSICDQNGITDAQLRAWNPDIDFWCSNLDDLKSICVTNPDGYEIQSSSTKDPSPPSNVPTKTVAINTEPFEQTPTTTLPVPDNLNLLLVPDLFLGKSKTDEIERRPNLADGTRPDCEIYFALQDPNDNFGANCWFLAAIAGITHEDFILWNPDLAKNGSFTDDLSRLSSMRAKTKSLEPGGYDPGAYYNYPCTLSHVSSYCVALPSQTSVPYMTTPPPPSRRATGEAAHCNSWAIYIPGMNCCYFIQLWGVTAENFLSWNPSIGCDCSKVISGTWYCVSVDKEKQPLAATTTTTTTAVAAIATRVEDLDPKQKPLGSQINTAVALLREAIGKII